MFQLSRAQVGRSPEKDRLLRLLLDRRDLDGGWETSSELAYYTGAGKERTPEIERAQTIESITVVRRLKDPLSGRLLSLALIPFASTSDALAYVPSSIMQTARKPFSQIATSEERFVNDVQIPALPNGVLYEVKYIGPERSGGERIITGALDVLVLQLNFRDTTNMWPWSDASDITERQVAKVRPYLSNG